MENLKKLINRITEFGINPSVKFENNVFELKQLLVSIYAEFVNLEVEFDEEDYKEDYDFSYEELRINVEKNFPSLSIYNSVFDCHKIEYKKNDSMPIIDHQLGDALDDITDIIKDLLEVKWRFENTSSKDTIWHFDFLMRFHSEQHMVELLKYLKDLDG